MKRVCVTALAVLMVVSAFGMAGCKGRKSRGNRAAARADAPATSGPARNTPSPTRSSGQAAGKSCTELLTQVTSTTKVAWKLDNRATQPAAESQRRPGSRTCEYIASGTSAFPPATMTVHLYRPDPSVDNTAEKVRDRAAKQAGNCAEKVAGPAGVTFAVQCLKQLGGGNFDVRTTYSGANGYVLALVAVQPTGNSSTLQAKVRDVSRSAAGSALAMI